MASLKRQKENNFEIIIQTQGKYPSKIKVRRHFHENKELRESVNHKSALKEVCKKESERERQGKKEGNL